MTLNDAQNAHTQAALTKEQERMVRYRPIAFKTIHRLIDLIEDEFESPAAWSSTVMTHWSYTVTAVSYAVSGQADGYFTEVYPWPDELLGALYK